MPTLNDVLAGSLAQAVQVQQIIDGLKGTPSKGVPISLTALSDSANYALTVKNNDATNSRALSVLKADGTSLITADATGVTIASPLNLPAGSITTTMLAANAITQRAGIGGITSNPQTTSTTYVDMPDMAVSLTTAGGDLMAWLTGVFNSSVTAQSVLIALSLDGAAEVVGMSAAAPGVGYGMCISTMTRWAGVASGSHTIKARWSTPGGTATCVSTSRGLQVLEIKR